MSSKNTKNKSGKNNESEVVSTDNSSTTKKEDTPTPVHLYDGGAVKLLLDDAIKNVNSRIFSLYIIAKRG